MTNEKREPECKTWKDFALDDKIVMIGGSIAGLIIMGAICLKCAQNPSNTIKQEAVKTEITRGR